MKTKSARTKRHKWEAFETKERVEPAADRIGSMHDLLSSKPDELGLTIERCKDCGLYRRTDTRKLVQMFRNGNANVSYVPVEKLSRDNVKWVEGKADCKPVALAEAAQ